MNTATEEQVKRLATWIKSKYSFAANPIEDYADDLAREIIESDDFPLPSSSVVSPLVWERVSTSSLIAKTPIGTYKIKSSMKTFEENQGWSVRLTLNKISIKNCYSVEEAISFAENHYQSLIASCLQGGGYTEEQMKDCWKRAVDECALVQELGFKYKPINFETFLSSLKQQPFKPCGEGENICSCKSKEECGYLTPPQQ